MGRRPKALISWSSGKDAAWALHEVRRAGRYDVVGALTMIEEDSRAVSIHGVRRELMDAQHAAAGLASIFISVPHPCTNAIFEARIGAVLAQARALGVTYLIFGDLCLEDIRAERHDRLAGSGIEPVFPIWGRPAIAREMIDAGLESYLVCVDLGRLPRQFAGRRFDHALLADLPAAVDPCGERGEYHTCVVAGPMFSRRIDVTVGATIEQDGYAYTDLIPGRTSGSVAQHPAGAL